MSPPMMENQVFDMGARGEMLSLSDLALTKFYLGIISNCSGLAIYGLL